MAMRKIEPDMIGQTWEKFLSMVYPTVDPVADAQQVEEMKLCYFSGAIALLGITKAADTFDPGLGETERDLAIMASLDNELREFARRYIARRTGRRGH